MPGGDGTGPMGMGPMTGRAAGYCAGYSAPGYGNSIPGRGRGGGRGFGRGFGWGQGAYPYAYGHQYYGNPYMAPSYPADITPKQEADMLKAEAKAMQEEIHAINQRVKDLESNVTAESDK